MRPENEIILCGMFLIACLIIFAAITHLNSINQTTVVTTIMPSYSPTFAPTTIAPTTFAPTTALPSYSPTVAPTTTLPSYSPTTIVPTPAVHSQYHTTVRPTTTLPTYSPSFAPTSFAFFQKSEHIYMVALGGVLVLNLCYCVYQRKTKKVTPPPVTAWKVPSQQRIERKRSSEYRFTYVL